MSFGFPAYYREECNYNLPADTIAEGVVSAFDECGWSFEEGSENHFTASIPMTWWSWGEKFSLRIRADGTLHLESKCRLPTQCIDWGSNRRNVMRFLKALDSQLGAESE